MSKKRKLKNPTGQKWFDVHFSLNGFVKMQAEDSDEACQKAEDMLNEQLGSIETAANTSLGVEIVEAVEGGGVITTNANTKYFGRSTTMGWTSCRMDKPLKEFISDLYRIDNPTIKYEVLECRIKNLRVAYLAVKTTFKEVLRINQTAPKNLPLLMGSLETEDGRKALAARLAGQPGPNPTQVWAGVCLIHLTPRSDFDITYKDLTEYVGPGATDCPESILKKLTPIKESLEGTYRGYAAGWRKSCWARIESLKSKPRLVNGCLVKFAKPIEFTGGWSADTVLVEDAFRQRYREPKRNIRLRLPRRIFQDRDYTILPKEIAEQTHALNSIIA
jgi:hypothetical protein